MMKSIMERVRNSFLHWKNGNPIESSGATSPMITVPGVGPVSQDRLNVSMVLLRNLLIALLLIQCVRSGGAIVHSRLLLRAMAVEEEQPPSTKMRASIETYQAIMEKGLLGAIPKEMPQQLLGILGSKALFGPTSEKAQEFALGAEVPGLGKIVAIHGDRVDLEKDGKKNTLSVFPAMKKKPN